MILTPPTRLLPAHPRVKWSSPLTRGLVGYWPLSDGGGLTVRDIAGGNHGTLASTGIRSENGQFGRSLRWTSSLPITDFVSLGTNASAVLNGSDWTVSLWCSMFALGRKSALFGVRGSGSASSRLISYGIHVTDCLSVLEEGKAVIASSPTISSLALKSIIWAVSGTANRLYVNGSLVAQVTYTWVGPSAAESRIGQNVATGSVLDGQISNVSIHSRALDPAEISLLYHRPLAMIDDAIELWRLASRATVPPTILVQPTSQDVYEGDDVSFSVVVSGDGPLSYQWRLNGVAIAGATSSTLSLIGVLPNQVGSYSVVVSNSAGSVVSAAAGLTALAGDVDIPVANRPTGFRVEDRTRLVPVSNRSTTIPIRVSL